MTPRYCLAVFGLCLTLGVGSPLRSPLLAAEVAEQPALEFYGYAYKSDGTPERAFLRRGGRIYIASEGDLIEEPYRLVRVAADSVVIEDVSSTRRQTLRLAGPSSLNDSAAAQPVPRAARHGNQRNVLSTAKASQPVK